MNKRLINTISDDDICSKINQILYRYSSIDENLKQSIINGYLWFSDPKIFNDPYDCNMQTQSECTYEELLEYFMETQPAQPIEVLEKRAYELSKNKEERLDLSRYADEHTIAGIGICCLSQKPDTMLMWSHYAEKHAGVCLGFDITMDKSLFGSKLLNLEYPQEYPVYNWPRDREKFKSLRFLIATKSVEWQYEDEVRIVRDQTDGEFRGRIPFDKKCLKSIIFGYRSDSSDTKALVELVKKDSEYSNVEFYQAKLSEYRFGINFEKIQ